MMPSKLDAAAALESMDTVAPSFDFGADDQTNALLLQDAQTFITGNMARIMAAKHAHDLTANHYKGSWGKWCAAVGISRDTGDNMVRVAEQFGNIQLEGKSIFDVQPMKLLYAAAKPSTPETVKQAVFTGDITTYKEYQDVMAQLKAEKERADAAENHEAEAWDMVSKARSEARAAQGKADAAKAERDAAIADVNGLMEQNTQLKKRTDAAEAERDKLLGAQNRAFWAERHIQDAEAQRDKAEARAKAAENQLAGARQVAEAARLRGDKLKAENDALKQQPITAVVDKEEVQRQAREMAADMTAELQAKLDAAAGDTRHSYDSVLLASRSMQTTWQMVKPLFRKLPEEQRETLANQIIHTTGQICKEVSECL